MALTGMENSNPLIDNKPASKYNRRLIDTVVLIAIHGQLGPWKELARWQSK